MRLFSSRSIEIFGLVFGLILGLCIMLTLYGPCSWGFHHGDPFCRSCGTQTADLCPGCNSVIKEGLFRPIPDFCNDCGSPLD